MSITLRFLGTAAGVPIPHVGCSCHQCSEARRERQLRRTRSAILLESPEGGLLVDAGPDIYRQLALLPEIPQIAAAIITHTHSDHYLGLDDLGSIALMAGWLQDGLLPIYATSDNWPRLEATFAHLFRPGMFLRFEARTLQLDTEQTIAGYRVRPFDSSHTIDVTTAMLSLTLNGKRVVYAPDLKVMPHEVFEGADVAIVSGTFYQRDHPAHMPLIKAIRTCKRLGVGRIIVTHVGHLEWSNAELWAQLSEQGADLAYDGATLVFDP
ncbi:MAG TPA: MBL fold metallo-hydrolase [Roseiflexaceae bacterium]|nr:MBL fold metallo-hydrolase [Roseiflexaceae bacterium]